MEVPKDRLQYTEGMKGLVMKFGGAAVRTPASFSKIAKLILEKRDYRVVAVVSAMGDMTDQLISLAAQVNPAPPARELDMLVSVGERISMSLLAMALAKEGAEAVSFTGSQAGIITSSSHTEAQIVGVRPSRILPELEAGKVVVVAGFQGVSENKEITTLGRGGSDTTAVALGAAIGAEHVEFYKDVPGIYDRYPEGRLYRQLSYGRAQEVVSRSEHPVLDPRSLALAEKEQIPLYVRSFRRIGEGTWVR